MNTKLSHSALSRYQSCGKSYQLHYIKKIRQTTTTGALLFGDALDKALTCLLLKEGDAYERFLSAFTYADINKVKEYIPTSELLVYADSDFDIDLYSEDMHQKAVADIKGTEDFTWEKISAIKDDVGYDRMKSIERQYYNHMMWQCLCIKAKYMIDGYKIKVQPLIKRVISTQEKIDVTNGSGDVLTGYIDLVAELEGHGVVIIDHKTSKRDYAYDSVPSSPQLTMYLYQAGPKYDTKKAGFIVLKKTLAKAKECSLCGKDGKGNKAHTCNAVIEGKRCDGEWKKTPFAEFQIIVDEIPERRQELVMENVDELNKCIKAELFPRNLNTCDNYYGGKCPFYNYCFRGSMKGLKQE